MDNSKRFLKARFIIVWEDGQHKTLENGYLELSGNRIEGYHTQLQEGTPYEDLGNVAITPGFINLHCHPSEVYDLRSYREDVGNPFFYESTLYDYAMLLNTGARAAQLQDTLNIIEMIKSGCTTGLIYGGGFSKNEAELSGELGWRAYIGGIIRAGDPMSVRGVWYSPDGHSLEYNFDEASGIKRLEEATDFVKEYNGSFDGRIRVVLAPTQTMTCTPTMLKATRKRADQLGVGITIHGSESLMEFEACLRMYGKTPVQFMHDNGMTGSDVIAAHCHLIQGHSLVNMAGDDDLRILANTQTTVAHCPMVLARSGSSLQSFARYTKAGINVGIGTDTFPSDYVQEMRQAAFMGKAAERTTFGASAKDIFYAATINGAKAFGRDDLGRLAPGAKADFVVFKLDSIEMTPVRDVVKNIVYSATRHSIDQVYVDGKCILKDGKVNNIDESALCSELQELVEVAWKKVGQMDRAGRDIDQLSPLSCPRIKK
jgi:5-methylthioadenosine/S-adenosylhomocysteine deaminase